MHLFYLLLHFSSVWLGTFSENKAVKIVQEPANYGGLQSYQSNNAQPKPTLKPFRKEEPFSGPYHLKTLYGKCFILTDNSYTYKLCPFFNITQHEQTWRWNAFQGILGVWKEWSIVNNTFEAMVMTDGDQCPGNLRRESKIFLKCSKSHKFVSVKEPRTCKYEVIFETPLACPIDAFLVYPALSAVVQKEWEEIEESLYHEELTKQGYEKRQHHLFVHAGFLAQPPQQDKMTSDIKGALSESRSKDNTFVPKTKFDTKQECLQAYSELLREFLKLRSLLEKENSSEKSNNISQISNVGFPASEMTRARGDTGAINEHGVYIVPSTDDKKQPLTTKLSTPTSPHVKHSLVLNPNRPIQTNKHNNN